MRGDMTMPDGDEISALLDAFAAQRQTEEAPRRPHHHAPLVWHTLVASDRAVTRAALNCDGDLLVQVLSMVKKYRAMVHIPRDQFAALLALLEDKPS